MSDLTPEQQNRAAALWETQRALHLELGASFDLVECAHWVAYGVHIPHPDDENEISEDAATWRAKQVIDGW